MDATRTRPRPTSDSTLAVDPTTVGDESDVTDPPVGMDESPDVVGRLPVRLLGLAMVAVLVVPLAWSLDRVEVAVDGDVQSVQVVGGTVGAALDRADVALGPADVVTPDVDAAVTDGLQVTVERAQEFTVIVDGHPTQVLAVASNLDEVLVAAGVGDVRQAVVSRPRSSEASDGMVVTVTHPHRVTIAVDDQQMAVDVMPGNVRGALAAAGVDVDDDDQVRPALDVTTEDGLAITVTRRSTTSEVEEVTLEHETQRVETDDRFEGEEVEVTEGVDGLREDTWEIRFVDGEEVSREVVSTEVVREPVDRVVEVGTAVRPPPEPEPEPEPAPEPESAPESDPEPDDQDESDPAPEPEPEPEPEPDPEPAIPNESVWDRLAGCESNGRWDLNTGLYDGGLQFHPDTWRSWKKSSYPEYAWQASKAQQIEAASRLQDAAGWSPWPHCSSVLGLR
ncbi:transglycosylase family protein [Salsipaludibacter albus]|uniref:transglycosylase family protein n=1 Tax=Salsipaludibacter albus TaxID=2849650 RepID=UPI001EE4AFFF|nr:transglycosylase family protein [Salsipaludibacter albus]MBY5161948.1 transglycosylase family protein [Salsipaludibacter albus]